MNKRSESKKGAKNPMYGKTHTEEARARISINNTGKILSEETKAKLSDAHFDSGKYWVLEDIHSGEIIHLKYHQLKSHNLSHSNLINTLPGGNRFQHKGYRLLRYSDGDE